MQPYLANGILKEKESKVPKIFDCFGTNSSAKDEIKEILQMTEDGTEEIISQRSKAYQKLNIDLDELPLKDLFDLIQNNPGILRRPIMLDEKRLQVGYNEDEIRRFLPRTVRAMELQEAQRLAGF